MARQWLSWFNLLIMSAVGCLLLGTAIVWFQRPHEILCNDPVSKQCRLPKNAFALDSDAYKQIGEPLLNLQSAPPSPRLPDLRQQLVYYGKNGRPDAFSKDTQLHFSLNGSKNVVTVNPSEKVHLLYNKKSQPSHYVFSPKNEETSLWFEATPSDTEVHL